MARINFKISILYLLLFPILTLAQRPEQDCVNALPICFDTYVQPRSFSGVGFIPNEINKSMSCLAEGERNDVWYTFTAQQDGNLGFLITPNSIATDDYDWAVYNLTNNICFDIRTKRSLEVSCNFAISFGVTGASPAGTSNSQGAGGTLINRLIPVKKGEVFVINVSNFSSSQSGYTIDFTAGSTASIFDASPPTLGSLITEPSCGQDSIHLRLSENIKCSSLDLIDFAVESSSSGYEVLEVVTSACSDPANYVRDISLVLDRPLLAGDQISIILTDEIVDICNNPSTADTLTFTLADAHTVTIVANDACVGDKIDISANASGNLNPFKYDYFVAGLVDEKDLPNNSYSFIAPSSGSHELRVVAYDKFGCGAFTTKNIEVFPEAIAQFTSQELGFLDFEFTGDASLSNTWDFGDGGTGTGSTVRHKYNFEGDYTVTCIGVSSDGCRDTVSTVLSLLSNAVAGENYIYVPTAFTPNGDGINDELAILSRGVKDFQLSIYNRWGEMIFTTNDYREFFKGTSKTNKALQEGIYVYSLKAVFDDDQSQSLSGTIEIIR